MRPSTPDAVLVQRVAAGDLIAQRELCRRHRLLLYGQVYAILWDAIAAELAVSEAFAQAWRTAPQFDPGMGSAPDWLSGIARAVALRRRSGLHDAGINSPAPNPRS